MAIRDDCVYIKDILDAISLAMEFVSVMLEAFRHDLKTQNTVIRQLEIVG